MRLPVQRAVEVCPVEVAVSVLGGTWKLTLIKHLAEGERRFGELGRLVPLANRKTLTRQLRELEEDGVLVRTVHPEVPPRVEYALTDLGRSLMPVVAAMDAWGGHFAQVSGLVAATGDEQTTV
ncbi:winged helix-turn-helix transcriptional regulator [Ruania zhangjianzhongii]|uniref:winged helix-turn-helix transcriptional regulator n=1 Tax=Ruania zhangjianzhongii TaxID=2603206 RepID=UPI0011CC7309|nr:helix-turn-helix domain-containing protein [Ruania zhangjianzhongii]